MAERPELPGFFMISEASGQAKLFSVTLHAIFSVCQPYVDYCGCSVPDRRSQHCFCMYGSPWWKKFFLACKSTPSVWLELSLWEFKVFLKAVTIDIAGLLFRSAINSLDLLQAVSKLYRCRRWRDCGWECTVLK